MKSAGLSSKTKKALRELTNSAKFAGLQENHFAAKERQRQLRMLAAKAQYDRQKKAEEAAAKEAPAPSSDV